jgi:hypothetical protein
VTRVRPAPLPEAVERLRQLHRKIEALPSLAMRAARVAEQLEGLDEVLLLGLLDALTQAAPPLPQLVLAIGVALDGGALAARRATLAQAALDGGLWGAHLVLGLPGPDDDDRPADDDHSAPPLLASPRDGRPLSLGERKSLARQRIPRERLDRLLLDSDPMVVEALLLNPHLTEADALRVAARRPTTAAALRPLLGCERFLTRPAIQRALALNPATPPEAAARLLLLVSRNDRREAALHRRLHPWVRHAATLQLGAAPQPDDDA